MAKVINFNPGKNVKAGIFEKYMKDNDLNFFQRRDTHDEKDSVAFITAIPAGSHRLACIPCSASIWASRLQAPPVKLSSVSWSS